MYTILILCFFKILDVTKSISCELQYDLRTKEISSLCIPVGDSNFKCILFSTHKLPRDMIEHFIAFDKGKLFESIWDECCDKLDKTSVTTFNDIYEHVWNETITDCKDLLHKLYKKSFTHSDIERFTDLKDINFHVTVLYSAMYHCYHSLVSSLPDPKEWIPQAVKKITMYLDFTKYSMQANSKTEQVNAVQLCLKLKELLRLKGNFSVVNILSDQVSICCKALIVKFALMLLLTFNIYVNLVHYIFSLLTIIV